MLPQSHRGILRIIDYIFFGLKNVFLCVLSVSVAKIKATENPEIIKAY